MSEPSARTLPRALDVALAGLALLVLSPLLVAVALAVWLGSGRPVLFRQLRMGRRGEPFHIHKFRTLVGGEEEDRIAPVGDPRVTTVGRFLRRSRLDELPQLYDVLRGRMALVGPRPETPANLARVDPSALERWLSVRPGITGATQLAFIAEDELLAGTDDPTGLYREVLVPAKVEHGVAWLETHGPADHLRVLVRTPLVLASRRAWRGSRRRVAALLGDSTRSERPGRGGDGSAT